MTASFGQQLLTDLEALTPKQVEGGLNSLEVLIADVKKAWNDKLANLPEDLQVGIDVTGLLSGLPVVGPDMKLANVGLSVVKFVVTTGVPHNSGEGGIGAAPEGNGNVTV